MIFDAFLVASEAEMLELRLRTLDGLDVKHLAVFCSRTHQGQPIPWEDNAYEMIQYARPESVEVIASAERRGRLDYHCVNPKMEKTERGRTYQRPRGERGPALSPWFQHIEKQHRNGIIDAVADAGAGPDDIVLVSDVDEIPRPSAVLQLADLLAEHTGWMVLEQRMYSTSLGLVHPHQPWLGTTATRARFLMPQMMRDDRAQLPTLPDAGHHLSWMGTDEERARKLDTFSHAELAGWDHVEARKAGRHSNGEQLEPAPEAWQQDLPLPIMDGSFTVPDAWK